MPNVIHEKISQIRRRHAIVRAGLGLSTMGLILSGALSLTMLIDWWFDLPHLARLGMLALHVSILGYWLTGYVIWPLIKGPDDETVALWVEAYYRDAASRVINGVQFLRFRGETEGVSSELMTQAIRLAEDYIEPKDATEVIPSIKLYQRIGVVLLVMVIFGAVILYGRSTTQSLLLRAMAVPGIEMPRKTHVKLLQPLQPVIARGDTVRIGAVAQGLIPDRGTLRVRYEDGQTADLEMGKDDPKGDTFSTLLRNVQKSFEFGVYLNDGKSEAHKVRVVDRPEVVDLKLIQHLPSYTGFPPIQRNKHDLRLLSGSRLEIHVTTNKPLGNFPGKQPCIVKLHGTDLEYELKPDPSNPLMLGVNTKSSNQEILLPDSITGLSIRLVDEWGLENLNPTVYRLEIVPDQPPVVRLIEPSASEELLTNSAQIRAVYEISDDIGLSQASIHWVKLDDRLLQGDGLSGEYFNNTELEGQPVIKRIDVLPDVSLNQSPTNAPIQSDHVSIRWTGKILIPSTGNYQFVVSTGDGVRMWIDDRLILDEWARKGGEQTTMPQEFKAGHILDVRIEYRKSTGNARCRLMWIRPDKKREVIPTAALFSSSKAVEMARAARIQAVPLPIEAWQRSVHEEYVWSLAQSGLEPGDMIEWWIAARDGNNQTGPGKSESDRRIVRIGTEAEVREHLLKRLGQPLEGIQDIRDRQVDLSGSMGQMIRKGSGASSENSVGGPEE